MAKRGRRGKGEGNIYYREEEGRWIGSFYTEDGQRKYVYDKTQQGALAKLRAAQREDAQGMLVAEPEQTLNVYLPHWLEKVHKSKIRLSTYTRYSILLKKHILPALGHIKVQKLTATHLQALYNRKLEEGLSAGVVRLLHAVLHKALRNALRIGLVSRNVCDLVDAPQPAQSEGQTLTTEQVHRLLEVAKGHDLEAIVTVAIMTGMRLGELLALRWQDIDLEKRNLQIRRTVTFLARHGYKETEPKTAKGRRSIALPHVTVAVLRLHRLRQLKVKLKAGAAWQEKGLVFSNASGEYLHAGNLRRKFRALLKQAGLEPMRFHDLRHSAATLLLSMGVHPKVVQEILGHSDITMTLDRYSHVLPSMQQEAMGKWDAEFDDSADSKESK